MRDHRDGGNDADGVAYNQSFDARSDCIDNARGFKAKPRGKGRMLDILSAAYQRLGAVQPQRLDADANLAVARGANGKLADTQNLRPSELIEHHGARHLHSFLLVRNVRYEALSRRYRAGIGQ